MDPQPSHVSVKDDGTHRSVLPSSSIEERSCVVPAEGSTSNSDGKDSALVEKVQEIAIDSGKTEWTASTASIHLTTNVQNKAGMFEEGEEGELDYEEDEGEIAQDDRNGVKNDMEGDDKEEGELEDEQDDEGEEGEILSDEDTQDKADKKTQEKQDSTNEADGPEEGEVIEDGDSTGALNLRRKVCRYFTYGGCTWGMSCRFLHPGLNDKGAYQMLPVPGQYPSPFPKVQAVVPPVPPEAIMPSFPDQDVGGQLDDEMADRAQPSAEPVAPPRKETAWERGLKLAKEIKKAAQKRKEEDADFEEKRMILGITAEGDEDENDKENLMRRREMIRSRLDKDPMFGEEEDIRNRRGGDIVSRWRDKRDSSPVRDRERRKKRAHRTPSSSPERDRRSRRRGGEKEKQKEKTKETVKEREKERTKKPAKELEKTGEEKVKKKKDKGKEKDKEIPVLGDGKNDVTQENHAEQTEQTISASKEQPQSTVDEKKIKDEERKKRIQEIAEGAVTKTAKEAEKKEDSMEIGVDEKDKSKPKALGISSSRLPNDEWIDPWQRTTSPKRHSVSSRSSRSRSSSSSSDSSRSSRSRSHSGSESRSTSRSASRSRSRSVSPTSSRSRSRSRSGSRSKSRSRSGSRSSGSDRSSSTSSNSPAKEVKTVQDEDRGAAQASDVSSESESESHKSKPQSPTPVQKSPTKLKVQSPDNTGPRTPPVESDRNIKENRNRNEYGRAEKSYGSGWSRRAVGVRPQDDSYSRQRGHHSRRGRSPDRRRRSRSPRGRNEDRRRADQSKTRERSSSADSMEHALARPSSPRTTRERGGLRRGSSASSSSSASSDSGSESEHEQHPAKTRRATPKTEQLKQAQNVPLTSGNIRYTGHKDIKLTLNKSVARTDNTDASKPSQHSPPSRSEASSSSDKQSALKKRPRDPSPVSDAPVAVKEAVSTSVTPQTTNKPETRSVDSPAEPASSAKSNTANTSSRREELLRELKAVEDAIARKRARIE
ncbi:uncharacterized protein LOC144650055 [Oculina patagonica]